MVKDRQRYEEALLRGQRLNQQQQWKPAFQAFRVAITEFPQEPEAYAGLGEACFGLKMLDRALDSYKRAARYSRGDIAYLQRVADLQERLGQLGEAARTYMAAGELQLRQRHLDAAIANWQRAVRLESSLLGAHRRLAMVFQRQDNMKAAVREYLAIARVLQMRGEQRRALQMCEAALRLDPENTDVLMAMELVRHGAKVLEEEEPVEAVAPPVAAEATEADEMAETVRQITEAFEEERKSWQREQVRARPDDPVARALRHAQDELAEEIFREEDASEAGTLSKLERDALIGQGMDFQARGQGDRAITCYEKAVAGGLELPAAYFTLGALYLEQGERSRAQQAFKRAARDQDYIPAIRVAWTRKR